MQYVPSKSDTSLLIKLSESEIDEKIQNEFDDYTLYNLFLQGLNVIVETGQNVIKLPVQPDKNNERIKISQHGMYFMLILAYVPVN